MAIEISNVIQEWYDKRTFPESWPPRDTLRDSEKDRWLIHTLTPEASENKTLNTCAKHIEDYKSWHRRSARAEFRIEIDSSVVNYQIHQTAVLTPHQPTKVTRTTLIFSPH